MTMTLISTVTVGTGGASSIAFSGVPSSFTDLQFSLNLRSNRSTGGADDYIIINTVNGASATGQIRILDSGSPFGTPRSWNTTTLMIGSATSTNSTASTFGNTSLYIPNYTSSTNKLFSVDSVDENNSTGGYLVVLALIAGSITSSAAISSMSFIPGSGTLWLEGSTISLYGIAKGSGGATVS